MKVLFWGVHVSEHSVPSNLKLQACDAILLLTLYTLMLHTGTVLLPLYRMYDFMHYYKVPLFMAMKQETVLIFHL
jgi:hypothetical protein